MLKSVLSRSRIQNISIALLACLVTVAAIDFAAFYVFEIRPAGYKPERFFHFSPLLGHFHKPNVEGYWHRYKDGTKYFVRTNAFGFADADREITKTRPRISLIGDSTTQFWEAEQEDRGQFVIERLTNHEFEVLNFGVRGYGTDQTYLLFRSVGIKFAPDIVIYLFCINDIWNNSDREAKPYFEMRGEASNELVLKGYPIKSSGSLSHIARDNNRLKDYSIFYRVARQFYSTTKKQAPTPLEKHFELRPYKVDYSPEDFQRLSLTLRIIRRLGEFVRSNGVKFMVVEALYRPTVDPAAQARIAEAYGNQFDFDKVTRLLRSSLAKDGIPFLSLRDVVIAQGIDPASLMHSDDNMHLNGAGISVYAEAVVAKLRSLGWIGVPVAMPAGQAARSK